MLLDVRRHVPLGVPLDRAAVVVPVPEHVGTAFTPRQLTLRGLPVFELNQWCGTCPALFQKLTDPEAADLRLADRRLGVGLDGIDDDVLRVYGQVLPESAYTVLLLEVTPSLVHPGSRCDYFSHEQVATWGVDPGAGSPGNPGTPYYRTFETSVDADRHLYEFVVPMVPPSWNDGDRVAAYSVDDGNHPTVVAYSLLDLVQPAMNEGSDYYEHWVLSHFLLDGHHKIEAAASAGRAVRLLCLVDEDISLAGAEDVTTMTRARSSASRSR